MDDPKEVLGAILNFIVVFGKQLLSIMTQSFGSSAFGVKTLRRIFIFFLKRLKGFENYKRIFELIHFKKV